MSDLTPPHDLDAERCVLGGMLLSADARIDVAALLGTVDFYDTRHGEIFTAIAGMDAAGEPVDVVTVTARLLDTGVAKRLRSNTYINDLAAGVPTAANAGWYARRVQEMAARRRAIAACTLGIQVASNMEIDADVAIEKLQAEVHTATTGRAESGGMSWAQVADETLEAIEAAGDRDTRLTGVSSGLVDVDKLTGGYRPGQLIVIAGRPGMGKSVMVLDACRNAAFRAGKSVALFSLEMSRKEIGQRTYAAETQTDLTAIQDGRLTDDQWRKIAMFRAESDKNLLDVDDSAGLSLAAIRAKARRIQQRVGLDLVAIDYLQLMSTPRRGENRQAELSEVSRGLKELARELNVPVVAAAQLNRGPESRVDKTPTMADVRESGSIESDADVVILLHRPKYYDKRTNRGSEIDVIVDKNRHGPTDTVIAVAQLHWARLADCAVDEFSAAALAGRAAEGGTP